ncbi:hypothetical protein L6164_005723 [Bauhinia variegata]|uniref:Uncharacterized protein n=1 Tax=Bauhinia variegata TaxID=167791 RepID=A0ACB9PU12_BAUVA|nr:hypothetical protein L6164_005723 [Bauhinia variegata]
MVARESYLEEQEAENEENTLLQDPYESEETLSLCDLPIHNDSAQWDDDFSKEDGHKSSSNNNDGDNDDFFEFFSEDFTASTRGNTEKDIIFCGKIIPFREPPQFLPQKGKNFQSNSQKGVVLSSKSARNYDSGSIKGQQVKGSKDLMCGYPTENVSLLRSTTKSKWYLFMFGMSSLPTQMELRDIRRRQSRRGPTAVSPVPEERESIKSKERRNGKGFWKIWSSLGFGCTGKYANDVVKASFRCV